MMYFRVSCLVISLICFGTEASAPNLRTLSSNNFTSSEGLDKDERINDPVWGAITLTAMSVGFAGLFVPVCMSDACGKKFNSGTKAMECFSRSYVFGAIGLFVFGLFGQFFAYDKFWHQPI